jgi:septal ring factor EnvC (AmiA/AmiB activator)
VKHQGQVQEMTEKLDAEMATVKAALVGRETEMEELRKNLAQQDAEVKASRSTAEESAKVREELDEALKRVTELQVKLSNMDKVSQEMSSLADKIVAHRRSSRSPAEDGRHARRP